VILRMHPIIEDDTPESHLRPQILMKP